MSIVDLWFLLCYFCYILTFLLQLSEREQHVYRKYFATSRLFLLYINISHAAVGQRIICLLYIFCFFRVISIIYINDISSAVNQISLGLFVDYTNLFINGYCANETLFIAAEK